MKCPLGFSYRVPFCSCHFSETGGGFPFPVLSQYEQKDVTGFPGRAAVTSGVRKEITVCLWALGGSCKHRGFFCILGFVQGVPQKTRFPATLILSQRLPPAELLSVACPGPSSPDPGYAGKGGEGGSTEE